MCLKCLPYFREQFPQKLFFFYFGLWSQYINMRKLFKGGNYSRKYIMFLSFAKYHRNVLLINDNSFDTNLRYAILENLQEIEIPRWPFVTLGNSNPMIALFCSDFPHKGVVISCIPYFRKQFPRKLFFFEIFCSKVTLHQHQISPS